MNDNEQTDDWANGELKEVFETELERAGKQIYASDLEPIVTELGKCKYHRIINCHFEFSWESKTVLSIKPQDKSEGGLMIDFAEQSISLHSAEGDVIEECTYSSRGATMQERSPVAGS